MAGASFWLASGVSLAALCAGVAQAQTPPPQTEAAAEPDEQGATEEGRDIVVTGSRIGTGFQAPTPVTVSTQEELVSLAPRNLADGLNQLPVFANSARTFQTTGGGLGSGDAGQNLLNLRNLGSNRLLVLLDGRRVVATNSRGAVDTNILPQNLVGRVEVVTGGASAAYGSDAVAGVVNFITDSNLDGFRVRAQGGISTYSDNESVLGSLAFGRQFLDGRVKILASFEYSRDWGVGILEDSKRDWHRFGEGQLQNPVAGVLPTTLVVSNLRSAIGSYGGLISSGPLRGTQFLAGGQSAPFQYAPLVSGTYMGGGPSDPNAGWPANALSPDVERQTSFASISAEVTPGLEVFAELLQARTKVNIDGALNFGTGTATQLTIFRDNAYLPADILARMVAANVQSIPLGRYYLEFGPVENESDVKVLRSVLGVRGTLGNGWQWDASWAWGESRQKLAKNNMPNLRRLFAASDAVRSNGTIVCRSTLAGFDPGCVPLNPFGLNSVSQEAADYILGDSVAWLDLEQSVLAANISGDLPIRLGAGPVGFAAGVEHRVESARQTSDLVSQQRINRQGLRSGVAPASIENRLGPYQFYNPQPFGGRYEVSDAYLELGVPLLADMPFFDSLDLNLAGRLTDYSQSGRVFTWKVGGDWSIIPDIRLRATRSRDIRGPNAIELFNTQTQTTSNVVYQGVTTQAIFQQSGNPNLEPEKADTFTYGVVLRPSFLRGLQLSADRFEIKIEDAIGSLSLQETINQCAAGNALACAQFQVQPGLITGRLQPLNLNFQRVSGWDFEAGWTQGIGDGTLRLRGLMTHLTEAFLQVPGGVPLILLGQPQTPKWSGLASADFDTERFGVNASVRYIGRAINDPNRPLNDLERQRIPAVAYVNLSARYRIGAGDEPPLEIYAVVNNVFNKQPPSSTRRPSSYNEPVNLTYDTIGRYFTLGVKASF
jgi:iron complex outermembrane recepter protein